MNVTSGVTAIRKSWWLNIRARNHHEAATVGRSVGRSVGRLVGWLVGATKRMVKTCKLSLLEPIVSLEF